MGEGAGLAASRASVVAMLIDELTCLNGTTFRKNLEVEAAAASDSIRM